MFDCLKKTKATCLDGF